MPRLHNSTEFDLFAPQIHETVPAFGSINITDEQARLFEQNSIFTVINDIPLPDQAAEPVGPVSDGEPSDEPPVRAKRQYAKRGSAVVEQDAAPDMETR